MRVGGHYLVLLGVFCLHQLIFARLWQDYWYLDDPGLYEWVGAHDNPLDFFLQQETVRKGGMNFYVTPMRQLSMWVDGHLLPLSPRLCYLHTIFSLALAFGLLFAVARRFMGANAALAACCLWLPLTSTGAVAEWLSARHYLEGFVLMLAGIWCLLRSSEAEGRGRFGWYLLALVTLAASVLSKEIYATTAFWFGFCLLMYRRRIPEALGLIATAAAYGVYRWWTVGLTLAAGRSSGGLPAEFFWRMPEFFAASVWGYLFVAMLIAALFLVRRGRPVEPVQWFFWGTNFLVALLPIQHLIVHLIQVAGERGDWYRVLFVWNSLLLFFGAWLMDRMERPRLAAWAALLAALVLVPVGYNASRAWDQRKQAYALYGRYYLAHRDHLLYFPLPGYYLDGLHLLYRPGDRPHFITDRQSDEEILTTAGRFTQVYGPASVGIGLIANGHRTVWANARKGRRPLLRKHPADDRLMATFRPYVKLTVAAEGLLAQPPSYAVGEPGVAWDVPFLDATQQLVALDLAGKPALLLDDPGGLADVAELAFYGADGRLLDRRQVGLTQHQADLAIEDLVPAEARLLAIDAEAPLRVWSYFRTEDALVFSPALAREYPQSVWLAHIPNPQGWSTEVRLYGTEGSVFAKVTPLLADGSFGAARECAAATGFAACTLPDTAVAARLEPASGTLAVVALHGSASGETTRYQPLQRPATRFELEPGRSKLAWQGLAVLNAADIPTGFRILDGAGRVLHSGSLPPRQKWVGALAAEARFLEGGQPLLCLLLRQIERGPLVASEPRPAPPVTAPDPVSESP